MERAGLDFLVVGVVAFLASLLTLYSGFGLGTVLLPAFALFFPVPLAVAATGAVHLLNNVFKASLLGRRADWRVVARFGLPAVPAAVIGAWLLGRMGETRSVFTWSALGAEGGPTAAGLAVGLVMISLAALELQPWFQRLGAPPRLLPVGGLVTGFIGGLSGQQGAFRSLFLLRLGLEPARFIATGVLIAILIDLSRLPTYVVALGETELAPRELALVGVAALTAFAGAYLGVRLVKQVTIGVVRVIVALLMLAIGAALALGLVGS
jgi:uncharacterized membrane protein YfcA